MDSLFYRKEKRSRSKAFLKRLLKKKRAVLSLIIGVPLVLYLLFGSHGIIQRVKLENQKAELEVEIREAEDQTKRLRAESKALDGDLEAIEKVAREKHGMIRDGETVYKVDRNKR